MPSLKVSGKSIYATLGIIIVSTVVCIMTMHSAYTYLATKRQSINEIKRSSKDLIATLKKNVANFIASYEVHEYEKLVETEMEHKDILAIIIEDRHMGEILGNKVYTSGRIRTRRGSVVEFDQLNKDHQALLRESLYSETRKIISQSGDDLGAISIYKSGYSLNKKLNQIISGTLFDAITISLALILTLFFSIRIFILKPLSNIDQIISHSDDHGIPIQPIPTSSGSREIVALSKTMNRMIKTIKDSRVRLSEQHAELKAREEQLQTLSMATEQSPASIVICNSDNIIEYVNPQFEKTTGYSSSEVYGQLFDFPFQTTDPDNQVIQLMDILGTGNKWVGELALSTKRGSSYWVRMAASPIFSQIGKITHFLFIVEDITEQKRSEMILRNSEKMDALGKLTGGIAHDYNNLLGIIQGYAEQIGKKITQDKTLVKYVQDIQHAAERGAKLTKKLLSFSRNKQPASTVLNISDILREQQHLLEKTLTARYQLNLDLENNIWNVKLDGSELEDAVLNMCINAMHAMGDSGKLTIKTSNEHLTKHQAKRIGLSSGDYVLLSISDTGCGMSSFIREKIFDPFYTTKGEQGTGLGLSQVYGFVDRSGGAITVSSEPDKGSCFSLYFPRTLDALTITNNALAYDDDGFRGNERILVVDDEQAMLELAQSILSNQGYDVRIANNGTQALNILEADKSIALVVSDIIMPSLDGYQLAHKIQKHHPGIKLLFVSGYPDNRHNETLDKEISSYKIIHKPYTAHMLLKHIRALLDEKKSKEITNSLILVIDDEEDVQELYRLNLNKLGCTALTASNSDEALSVYKHSMSNGTRISAVITDLSLPGGLNGKELASKIKEMDPTAKIIVASGSAESPEMTDYASHGFDGAIEKKFDRRNMKKVLERLI